LADAEGECAKADTDGCSTADTSCVPSPLGNVSSVGSTLGASRLSSPTGTLSPGAGGFPALWLAGLVPQMLIGSPELPTEGSGLHHFGTCKPCAFFFKGGCSNGVACGFCHLCPPGEKELRKRERKAMRRGMRTWPQL